MLSTPAPFPEVGSYALFIDPDLPPGQAMAELARILRRDGDLVAISLPLRIGATGNKTIRLDQLHDGTALTQAEEREFADLDRSLPDSVRQRPRSKKARRHAALRDRIIWNKIFADQMRTLRLVQAKQAICQGGSPGARIPVQSEVEAQQEQAA